MADNLPRLHLVCYDIGDPKRLRRVHHCMVGWGVPVQYSVFIATLVRAQVDLLIGELEQTIDPAHDDVRIYPLPIALKVLSMGRSWFPEGISLVEKGRDLLDLDEEP
ncbi:MAG: CRISPR-associated endonuclease Cas2 [Pseudomonadota bacterium]